MARFLPDTSCIVAALLVWHEHHERAAGEIERRLDLGEHLVMAAPALVETYAVLTRLPPRHRLSPTDSRVLLEANFQASTIETVALDATAYWRLIRSAPAQAVAGGGIYDAVIFACGLAGRVDVLLTFNERQFRPLAVPSLQIVVPRG
jgi:predicted nucleic acid-binding protein